ncbi:MAG: hypothetical protein Q8P18_15035 [Pseudomonadota bacterium]|nr:hypothetical protein [Pseudomonadota bacterium]
MSKFLSFAFLSLSLAACGGVDPETACVEYLDAYSACASEAYGVTDGSYDLDTSTCDAYSGLTGAAATDSAALLTCYADAYNAADCSTTEGFTAASTDVTACASAQ